MVPSRPGEGAGLSRARGDRKRVLPVSARPSLLFSSLEAPASLPCRGLGFAPALWGHQQDKETTERLREKYAKKLLVAGGQQLQVENGRVSR